MSQRMRQTTGDPLPEYRQDLPETQEPCRLCEPQEASELKERPASGESSQHDPADGPVERDRAASVGQCSAAKNLSSSSRPDASLRPA